MNNFKQQFPASQVYTYLNTASTGLVSEKVLEFRQEHGLDLLVSGNNLGTVQENIITECREAVGKFFNAEPHRVALIPNFSFGFNTLMEGVEASKKVLLLEDEYPSINWAVESRGFQVSYVPMVADLEERIFDAVEKEHPDIFVFSLVQWINGVTLELEFLKKLKNNFPKLLLVADGTQFCGTEPFDFDDSPLDVLGASAYKWLNAGFGNAFFLFKEAMEDQLSPKAIGFGSRMGKYKAQEDSLIGKFEPGHLDPMNFGSLLVAIQHLEDIGMEQIETQIKALSSEARNAFEAAGLLPESITKRQTHSSIFNIKGDEALFKKLISSGILCSQRGQGIRLSFHYYNEHEDLEKLMHVLRRG